MAKFTAIAPTTSAVNASSSTVFPSDKAIGNIVVIADTLATTEEVDIYTYAGNDTWKVTLNEAGSAALKLTASIYSLSLPSGPLYRFAKDATASASGVIVHYNPKVNR